MAKFLDDEGREWEVRLNHTLLREIRDATGLDLHNLTEQGKALVKMADDQSLLVDTVYLTCERQCARRGISSERFGEGFAKGETFELAAYALRDALLDFTRPLDRDLAAKVLDLTEGQRTQAVEMARGFVMKAMEAMPQTTSG